MIDAAPQTVLAVFLIFCRIGGALMIMPGFSSSYVPPRVRLSIALLVTLALAPLFLPAVEARLGTGDTATVFALILSESATGFVIGFVGRVFFSALSFIGAAATQAIGLSAMPGTIIEDSEQPPPMAALLTITATTMIFAMNLHWEVIHGLVDSYGAMPPGEGIGARIALVEVTDQLTAAFLLALRIGAPFLIYSVIFNFALGITNKLTPQIPVFFIAMPFATAGGLLLLFFVVKDFMLAFMGGFSAWLGGGRLAMASRLTKLKRIVAVQDKLHRLEEFRLGALTRRAAELREDETSLVAALNDSETFAGLFVDAMASQLKRIAMASTRVEAAQAAQDDRVREAALRLKRTERFTDKTGREERRAQEKQVFQELLDALRGGIGDASPV